MQNKINTNIKIAVIAIFVIIINAVILYTTYTIVKKNSIDEYKPPIYEEKQKSQIVLELPSEDDKIAEVKSQFTEEYPTGKAKYYIKVNIETQTVNIYEKDKYNRYSIPVKVMLCSTGIDTPNEGVFTMTDYKRKWLALEGKVYGQYCTQITGDILFHSVPYLENNNPASLEYWEYDKLGEKASLGCVRLTVENAKWIFENCGYGTNVEFYYSENPGPLEIGRAHV